MVETLTWLTNVGVPDDILEISRVVYAELALNTIFYEKKLDD